MSNDDNTTVTKRKVGRPSKHKKADIQEKILGIVDRPDDDSHLVELFTTKPTIFKKMLAIYYEYDADNICFRFDEERAYISYYTAGKKILTVLEGAKCNKYYCEKPVEIYVECENFLRMHSFIEQEYDYDYTLVIKQSLSKRKIAIIIINKSNGQREDISINEVNPSNKLFGPMFDSAELTWPIAFSCESKSFKRKFTNQIKMFNNEVRMTNDPVSGQINMSIYNKGRTSEYEIGIPALTPINQDIEIPEITVCFDIKPLKMFLKNAVDENTKIFINASKICCMSSDLGKVKGKGEAIGITKLYIWNSTESIEEFLPESERGTEIIADTPTVKKSSAAAKKKRKELIDNESDDSDSD